jgi:hypothetical protein
MPNGMIWAPQRKHPAMPLPAPNRHHSPDASTEPTSTLRDSHRPGMSASNRANHWASCSHGAVAAKQKIMVSAVFKKMTPRVHCE